MPQPPIPADASQLRKDTIEEALREGFTPQGQSGGRGSAVREAAKRLNINANTLGSWLETQLRWRDLGENHFAPDWSLYRCASKHAVAPTVNPKPLPTATLLVSPRAKVSRYILTGAQDDTEVHIPFWRNLLAYAADIGAEIMVGGFTYNKAIYTDHETRHAAFAAETQPYLRHDNVMLGPLMFAARMNTLPTAVKPLSGLDAYTRGAWGVFPHAKVQLVSVPALPGKHPAMIMTTGACTVPNYIEKKAGIKAEFHHQIGATLVEIDSAGRTFCRQLVAADDGSFQDLDAVVRQGRITRGNRVEGITWGDIHREQIDPVVALSCWGLDIATERQRDDVESMIDALRPRHQFFHDLLDFRARNHHRRGDHHHRRAMLSAGADIIDSDLAMSARFLRQTERDWCVSVVVPSNHNDAFQRWLREADPREDAQNAPLWCRANAAMYDAIDAGDDAFDVFRWGMERHDKRAMADIVFPPRNGSYAICQAAGGIECAIHGDQGPNGARGSALSLTKVATRMNIGHSHSAAILDGVYQAGLCGLMDQGYNAGPSSWSATQIITYSNGRRTLVTLIDGRWRAQ